MTTPYESPDAYHVYHQYTIRTVQRDTLAAYLKERSIATMIYYPIALHLQRLYAGGLGDAEGSPSTTLRQGSGQGSGRCLPMSEVASREVLSLPMYAELTEGQQTSIGRAIRGFHSG